MSEPVIITGSRHQERADLGRRIRGSRSRHVAERRMEDLGQ